MRLTCLSKGNGFYYPPSHILDICGFRILLECPLDLSSLVAFSPLPYAMSVSCDKEAPARTNFQSSGGECDVSKRQKIEKPVCAEDLIRAQPWYKVVKNLRLWNACFIDAVIISTPAGLLGLPFFIQEFGFSGKVYATQVTSRIGHLMMEDLISTNNEFLQFYGPCENGGPEWMKWKKLELLPLSIRDIILGEHFSELGDWFPLYSTADVKNCIERIQTLKFGEETCYNGTIILKPLSSGLELGACNWTICSPKGTISYISGSIFESAHAMNFDYPALQGSDLILYSDLSFLNIAHNTSNTSGGDDDSGSSLNGFDDFSDEINKMSYICSCMVGSVKAGGSVVISIGRIGVVLHLLELIYSYIQSSACMVPIFFLSSAATELLTLANVIPEWLCVSRQEKLYSGESLFAHVELMKDKKLHLFSSVYSPEILETWKEPCIVISPHWTMRLGSSLHLLLRWRHDPSSLFVFEDCLDSELAILPFQPISMKILNCSFLSGIKPAKIQPLFHILQPKCVLVPEALKDIVSSQGIGSSCNYLTFNENQTVKIPGFRDGDYELEIEPDLANRLCSVRLDGGGSRLEGEFSMVKGKCRLGSGREEAGRAVVVVGGYCSVDLGRLEVQLRGVGVYGVIDDGSAQTEGMKRLCVREPKQGLVEVGRQGTVISAVDRDFASLLFEAVRSVMEE